MIEQVQQLLSVVDTVLREPLTASERHDMSIAFLRVLARSPTVQVCEAIDQLKQRGIGVTAVECGEMKLALYQLHRPSKPGEDPPDDDDPIFDAVR